MYSHHYILEIEKNYYHEVSHLLAITNGEQDWERK